MSIILLILLIYLICKQHKINLISYPNDGLYLCYEKCYHNRTFNEHSCDIREIKLITYTNHEPF